MKESVYNFLECPRKNNRLQTTYNVFMLILILASVVIVALHMVPTLPLDEIDAVLELLILLVFVLDISLRIWSANVCEEYSGAFWGRLKYIFSFYTLLDIIATIPLIVCVFLPDSLMVAELRIMVLLRVMRLLRRTASCAIFFEVLRLKKRPLTVIFSSIIILVIFFGTAIFITEFPAQPTVFSGLLQSFWWAVMTMTTVGYGDIVPITALGKLIAALSAVCGIGLFGLTTALLAAGFRQAGDADVSAVKCPECGATVWLGYDRQPPPFD